MSERNLWSKKRESIKVELERSLETYIHAHLEETSRLYLLLEERYVISALQP